jgi:hypothetical protein
MNLPGFTAEASLYETRESYRVVGAGASASAQVLPAASLIRFDCESLKSLCSTGNQMACDMLAVMLCPEPGPFVNLSFVERK